MVVNWKWHLAFFDEPWEDQRWEEPEEANFPDDPELEDQFGSLEEAEAFAVTEFKNASSDMKNAKRTFMEAKDLVSRVKHERGSFLVVGVGAFRWFSNNDAERTRFGKGKH